MGVMRPSEDGRRRVVIENVQPEIDAGRFPIKRTVGEKVVVEADVFTDGHDAISGVLLYRVDDESMWLETPLSPLSNDRWRSEFGVSELGRYWYTVEAWVDPFLTWRRDLLKRVDARQDTALDYQVGAEWIDEAIPRASAADSAWLSERAQLLRSLDDRSAKTKVALDAALLQLMARYPDRARATRYARELSVAVDREKARFSSWYELFPRSTSPDSTRPATFHDCEARLPYIASMGFDVVYLPPVHPIGLKHRKGKNNVTAADAQDVGSPWAIGGLEGGHHSIHPELGSLEDFRRLVDRAHTYDLEIALDIAFQASPDHPYAQEHPEWFRHRPDGTIQYAENPPKKYEDIYPFDFESDSWRELWEELKSIFFFWINQGVHIFRVDNPHTKPFPFWEWVIQEIKSKHPEVIFLSEAFTRPKVMYRLAKVGFTQSYTYFPWRNTKWELTTYMTELTQTEVREFFRPNHWPNTPDILTEYLQTGQRAAFMARLVLAATLGANYGIYGPAFELMENRPRHTGSEEYLDSEKYQLRSWDLDRPDSLREFIALVNRIRRENPALHSDWSLRFHTVSNDQIICYSKHSSENGNLIIVVVNLDPHHVQSGFVELPLQEMQIETDHPFQMHDLLSNARYLWSGTRNYVQLDPQSVPAQIFRVRKQLRTEKEFEYFL